MILLNLLMYLVKKIKKSGITLSHFPNEKANSLQKRWNRLQLKRKIVRTKQILTENSKFIYALDLDVKLGKVLIYILETRDYSTLKEVLPILLLLTWKQTYVNSNTRALTQEIFFIFHFQLEITC